MYIIYEGKDGSVAISTLVNDNVDIVDVVEKFRAAHPGIYTKFNVHKTIDVPDSRQFRDAWKIAGGKIVVDNKKAKQIHLDRIRELRNKKLEELDKEAIKNITDENKLQEIEQKKQILRDIPQNYTAFDVDSPHMPSELI